MRLFRCHLNPAPYNALPSAAAGRRSAPAPSADNSSPTEVLNSAATEKNSAEGSKASAGRDQQEDAGKVFTGGWSWDTSRKDLTEYLSRMKGTARLEQILLLEDHEVWICSFQGCC